MIWRDYLFYLFDDSKTKVIYWKQKLKFKNLAKRKNQETENKLLKFFCAKEIPNDVVVLLIIRLSVSAYAIIADLSVEEVFLWYFYRPNNRPLSSSHLDFMREDDEKEKSRNRGIARRINRARCLAYRGWGFGTNRRRSRSWLEAHHPTSSNWYFCIVFRLSKHTRSG